MERDTKAIIGVLFILFGIGWMAFANVQPEVVGDGCGSNVGPFSCLNQTATLFYPLGFLAFVIGAVILVWDYLPKAGTRT